MNERKKKQKISCFQKILIKWVHSHSNKIIEKLGIQNLPSKGDAYKAQSSRKSQSSHNYQIKKDKFKTKSLSNWECSLLETSNY